MKNPARRDVKRRIFGAGADGVNTTLYEGPLHYIQTGDEPPADKPGEAGEGVYMAWATAGSAPDSTDLAVQLADFNLQLKPGATRFFRVELPPGAECAVHRTPYVNDYFVALSGALTMYLEDGTSSTIEAGDMFVQLAGWHSWKNEGSEPFVMAGLMLGIETDAQVPFGYEPLSSEA